MYITYQVLLVEVLTLSEKSVGQLLDRSTVPDVIRRKDMIPAYVVATSLHELSVVEAARDSPLANVNEFLVSDVNKDLRHWETSEVQSSATPS